MMSAPCALAVKLEHVLNQRVRLGINNMHGGILHCRLRAGPHIRRNVRTSQYGVIALGRAGISRRGHVVIVIVIVIMCLLHYQLAPVRAGFSNASVVKVSNKDVTQQHGEDKSVTLVLIDRARPTIRLRVHWVSGKVAARAQNALF